MYLNKPELVHRLVRVGAMTYLEKPLWQIVKRSRPCSAWSFRSAPAASQPDDRWPEKKRSKNFSSPEQKKFQPIPKKIRFDPCLPKFWPKMRSAEFSFFLPTNGGRSNLVEIVWNLVEIVLKLIKTVLIWSKYIEFWSKTWFCSKVFNWWI